VHLETWQWLIAALAAFGVGLSKTGLPGVGIFSVALFAMVVDAQASVGLVLPLLICGDVCAVASYRRHADWKELRRLFPWAGAGVVAGWGFVKILEVTAAPKVAKNTIECSMGVILISMVVLHLWRKSHPKEEDAPHGPLWTPVMGLMAGFTTMIANAAGPVMVLYLLAANLSKMAFMGTSAWYFLTLNIFKVPFSINLGMINWKSLPLDGILAPCTVIGALAGRALLPYINQRVFESIALGFSALAGAKLLITAVMALTGH
jgi:hypothetical protein